MLYDRPASGLRTKLLLNDRSFFSFGFFYERSTAVEKLFKLPYLYIHLIGQALLGSEHPVNCVTVVWASVLQISSQKFPAPFQSAADVEPASLRTTTTTTNEINSGT